MKIGIDIQEVDTLVKFFGTHKMARMFTEYELGYIAKKNNAIKTIAGLFCAKEAFFKALGSGLKVKQLPDIEVRHTETGAPYFALCDEIVTTYKIDPAKISLSISHTKTTAVAVVVIQ